MEDVIEVGMAIAIRKKFRGQTLIFLKLRPQKSEVYGVSGQPSHFNELDHRHLVDECRSVFDARGLRCTLGARMGN